MHADRLRKSVGAENTFITDLTNGAARAALQPIIEKVWRYCESSEIRARTVTLKVKYADFEPDHAPPHRRGAGLQPAELEQGASRCSSRCFRYR